MMADGVSYQDAWPTIPNEKGETGNNEGGSARYRDKIRRDPVFVQRLAALQSEKDELVKDELFGDVIWMTKQTYRMAVAARDVQGMQRASAQLKEIAMQRAGVVPGAAAAPEKGSPGAPSVKPPGLSAGAEHIRRQLLDRPRSEQVLTRPGVFSDAMGEMDVEMG